MSENDYKDLERRISKLEGTDDSIRDTLSEISTTLALLNQTVQAILERENQRKTLVNRIWLFVAGGLISAVMAWIFRGGLGQ